MREEQPKLGLTVTVLSLHWSSRSTSYHFLLDLILASPRAHPALLSVSQGAAGGGVDELWTLPCLLGWR